MQKHFVTFYSPGTLVGESTTKPISAWDTDEARRMASEIVERHGARPYCFRFSTRARADDELDSRKVASSPLYYLGGKVQTIDEIRAEGPSVLLSNMETNGWDKVITTEMPWEWARPLEDDDIVLDMP